MLFYKIMCIWFAGFFWYFKITIDLYASTVHAEHDKLWQKPKKKYKIRTHTVFWNESVLCEQKRAREKCRKQSQYESTGEQQQQFEIENRKKPRIVCKKSSNQIWNPKIHIFTSVNNEFVPFFAIVLLFCKTISWYIIWFDSRFLFFRSHFDNISFIFRFGIRACVQCLCALSVVLCVFSCTHWVSVVSAMFRSWPRFALTLTRGCRFFCCVSILDSQVYKYTNGLARGVYLWTKKNTANNNECTTDKKIKSEKIPNWFTARKK